MDVLGILRTLGALALLLGLLGLALWAVRRFDLRLPGAGKSGSVRRLELVERLSIDQRRSAVLIRRDDREHLLIVSPEGQLVVETFDRSEDSSAPAMPSSPERTAFGQDNPPEPGPPTAFTALLDQALAKRPSIAWPSRVRIWDRKR